MTQLPIHVATIEFSSKGWKLLPDGAMDCTNNQQVGGEVRGHSAETLEHAVAMIPETPTWIT